MFYEAKIISNKVIYKRVFFVEQVKNNFPNSLDFYDTKSKKEVELK